MKPRRQSVSDATFSSQPILQAVSEVTMKQEELK